MFKRVLLAFAVGLLATGLLIGLSFAADSLGFPAIASALSWENTLLQSYVPPGNIGTAARPVYEGSPLNFLAFLASIPLAVIIYGVLAYAALTWARRRAQQLVQGGRLPRRLTPVDLCAFY